MDQNHLRYKTKPICEAIKLIQPYLVRLEFSSRLVITIDASAKSVRVEFPSHQLMRERDESFALRTNDELQQGRADSHWIYEVLESDLLEWFHEETLGVYKEQGVRHYLIATSNEYVDVLSMLDPVVSANKLESRV
jgi:hypothetical protein